MRLPKQAIGSLRAAHALIDSFAASSSTIVRSLLVRLLDETGFQQARQRAVGLILGELRRLRESAQVERSTLGLEHGLKHITVDSLSIGHESPPTDIKTQEAFSVK